MKQVPVAELIPGMVTAEDIIGYDSNIIIPKGVILTENIISRLDSYSIYYVQIIDDIVEIFHQKSTRLLYIRIGYGDHDIECFFLRECTCTIDEILMEFFDGLVGALLEN